MGIYKTNNALNFDKAEAGDVEALAEAHAEAFGEAEEMYGKGPPGYKDPKWHLRMLGEHTYIKISNTDGVVGGIIVHDLGDGEYFLDTLYVRPSFQNLGFGRQAVMYIERAYPDAKKWSLVTPYRDFRNHHFYESLDYVKVGEIAVQDEEMDPDFTLFKYEKLLD